MSNKATHTSKPRGRPALAVDEGKRYPLSLRTTKDLKEKLESASRVSGRSIAQEVEHRLEQSFKTEANIADAIAAAMGGKSLAALFRLMGAAAELVELRMGGKSWVNDAVTFYAVQKAWQRLINQFGPPPHPDLAAHIAKVTSGPAKLPRHRPEGNQPRNALLELFDRYSVPPGGSGDYREAAEKYRELLKEASKTLPQAAEDLKHLDGWLREMEDWEKAVDELRAMFNEVDRIADFTAAEVAQATKEER
jgi:hypothetical protein